MSTKNTNGTKSDRIYLKDESYAISGAVFNVYREMGCGFLEAVYQAQVMNYLKATGFKLGLLVNFGCYPKATVDRIVL